MATEMIKLENYVVTDTGEVIVNYNHLVLDLLLMGKSISGLQTFRYSDAELAVKNSPLYNSKRRASDVDYYNMCEPERAIKVIELDGKPESPPASSFEYNLPEKYLHLDLVQYFAEKLTEKFPDASAAYIERITLELDMLEDRQMNNFLRALIYMIETFEEHGVVYGVGRGSACASLVMYLIGVHQVDPIEYDIPINEFLR